MEDFFAELSNGHRFFMVQFHSKAKISKTKCLLFFFAIVRTGIITEMILFLSLFLQLKIRSQGQVPRLGGANKVGVYRGI